VVNCSSLLAGLLLSMPATQEDPARQARLQIERLKSDKVEEREDATRKLKELGDAAASELEKACRGQDPEVASRAKLLLRIIQIRAGLPEDLRKAFPGAEERLAQGESHVWTDLFNEAISLDARSWRKHPRLRSEDLEVLVVPALQAAATLDEKKPICKAASEWGLRSAIPDLIALLPQGGMQDQWDLAYYLVQMRAQEAIPEALKLVDHPNRHVGGVALSLLGRLGSKGVVPELIRQLDSRDDNLRIEAAQHLIGLGIQESLPKIVKVIKSVGDRAGWSHTLGFKGMDAREVVPDLLSIVKDPNSTARGSALGVLGALGVKEAAPEIEKALGDAEPYNRAAAARALGRLRVKESIPKLIPVLQDPDQAVRRQAALALATLGAQEALPGILRLLASKEFNVRSDAVRALGILKAREAIPAISKALSADRNLGGEAAMALGSLGAKEEIPAIVKLLQSEGPQSRFGALRALGQLKATGTASEMAKLLVDPEAYVRHEAAMNLCRMGSWEGVPVILGEEYDLNGLNALRQPELWQRLEALGVETPIEGTSREILERLAKMAGLRLDCPSHPTLDQWWMRISWEFITFVGAVNDAAGSGFRIVVEPDRIRVLPRDHALEFWRSWFSDHEKKR
jgi:HEAT repeat protein